MELSDLPPELLKDAFVVGAEAAWPRAQALEVIRHLADQGVVLLGGEVWFRGPRVPRVLPYTWDVTDRQPGESHRDHVERARKEAVEAMARFPGPRGMLVPGDQEPLFNLAF